MTATALSAVLHVLVRSHSADTIYNCYTTHRRPSPGDHRYPVWHGQCSMPCARSVLSLPSMNTDSSLYSLLPCTVFHLVLVLIWTEATWITKRYLSPSRSLFVYIMATQNPIRISFNSVTKKSAKMLNLRSQLDIFVTENICCIVVNTHRSA